MSDLELFREAIDIKDSWGVFDYNNDGLIPAKDLYHIITRLGGPNKLSKDEAG
jgi:Ca2+-binding EF-hand superfamily protein